MRERQAEFLALVEKFIKNKGNTNNTDTVLQVGDFKKILSSFGVTLTAQVSKITQLEIYLN